MSEEKKVYYYDEDGFAATFTLEEGTVTRFFPQDKRRYGFISMDNGQEVFFHTIKAKSMGPFETHQEGWIPRFLDLFGEKPIDDPKPGDRLVFLTRQETKGLAAWAWSTLERYEEAVRACTEIKSLSTFAPSA